MKRTRFTWLATAVAVLGLGLTACGDDDDDGGAGETELDLTIGDSLPLSGDLADFGPPGEKAADLAVAQIQAAIDRVNVDHTVELVHEDNSTDPQAAVQAARKMIEVDGASCIAGAWASADSIPTFESVTSQEGVLQISPASTSDEITTLDDPEDLMNRTSPPDSFQGPTLAAYMDQELGGAEGLTVNLGARNDAYGTGLADAFSAAWQARGGTIGEEVIYDTKLPNYDSEASQITAGNPDAFVIIDFPETFNKVGPALVRTGDYEPSKTFVTDGLSASDLLESAGEEAVNGLRGTAPGAPDEDKSQVAFDALYKDSEPKDVGRMTFDVQNFDATILCYLAAVAAGSTDGTEMAAEVQAVSAPPGDAYTWEELDDAVEALQNGDDIDYEGASGAVNLDDAGDATAGVYDIFEFKEGGLELVDEVPVATPEG
jgi:ABC-type branched-subunit amino acid transport system substrate-binding protein